MKHLIQNPKTIITALLFVMSSMAQASLYNIVCVECSLTTANYELKLPGNDSIISGELTVTGDVFGIDSLFSEPLYAHDINFYWGAGTYTFDSMGDTATPAEQISMTVNANQIGMHFLFDWSSNNNVDVINVFDVNYINGDMVLTSTDVDGNGIAGFAMVDGPFQGSDLALNFTVATPVPAALWLFGSGFLGLIGFARSRKK